MTICDLVDDALLPVAEKVNDAWHYVTGKNKYGLARILNWVEPGILMSGAAYFMFNEDYFSASLLTALSVFAGARAKANMSLMRLEEALEEKMENNEAISMGYAILQSSRKSNRLFEGTLAFGTAVTALGVSYLSGYDHLPSIQILYVLAAAWTTVSSRYYILSSDMNPKGGSKLMAAAKSIFSRPSYSPT